jgi:hypothetical protein
VPLFVKNIEKMLLQMTNGFLQLESTSLYLQMTNGFLQLESTRYTYSLFFNQRTTTPQFTPKIELTTLYTFDIG